MLSSPSFGSHHECSDSIPPVENRPVMQKGFLPSSHLIRFRYALEFLSLRLAYMLDSLVRVSRRVVRNLLTSIDRAMVHELHCDEWGPPLLAQTKNLSTLTATPICPYPRRDTRSCSSVQKDVGSRTILDPRDRNPQGTLLNASFTSPIWCWYVTNWRKPAAIRPHARPQPLQPRNWRRQTTTSWANLQQSTVAYAFLLTISSAFDPLFRVLFTFPSQYFFAIGLVAIFSFGWDQPPS